MPIAEAAAAGRGGVVRTVAKSQVSSGIAESRTTLCCCAPHPVLNRGGEFCYDLSVSQQKLLDPNQPDPFIVQRCTFPKIGGASLQKGIGAASIPVVSTLGDDGNIPALLRIMANSHSHRADD